MAGHLTMRSLQGLWPGRAGAPVWRDIGVPDALWAVGDVHGRADLYARAEVRIRDLTPGPLTIVLLGDVIDRGPDSRAMLDLLTAPAPEGVTRLCLMGNHEDMALQFLQSPLAHRGWLTAGGDQVLRSYGIDVAPEAPPVALRDQWRAVLPAPHLAFLRALPHGITAGRHILTHAGAEADTPLARQSRRDLIWGKHAAIADLRPPADLGDRLVVHGHVPVPAPVQTGWRLNLDTGAWKTGRLSAARLYPDRPHDSLTIAL